jgi:exopolysaccharide biosynthesis polyprenyl glycosylphosphotransferase
MSQARRIYCRLQSVFDLVGLIASWYGVVELRLLLNPYMRLQFSREELYGLAPPLPAVVLLWVLTGLWLRTYRPKPSHYVGGAFVSLVEAVAVASTLTIVVTFFSRQLGADMSRSFVILFVPVALATLIAARYIANITTAMFEKKWPSPERIAVLGHGPEARGLVERVRSAGHHDTIMTGVILPQGCSDEWDHAVPVLGTTRTLAEVINRAQLSRIIVVNGGATEQEVDECGVVSRRMGVVVSRSMGPALCETRMAITDLCGVRLLELTPIFFTRKNEIVKRCFDIAIAATGLVLLAPIFLVFFALVKLTSTGPLLYKARRVGKGGRHFTFLKLRSMYCRQPARSALASRNEKAEHLFKIKKDPRVTPLGRFMRRYSIDEIPQLINILFGDMSLVGPRPLPAEDLDPDGMSARFRLWSEQRSRVLPGLTGLWQIRGRSDLTFERMIELDVEYIRTWSLGLDLRILMETPLVVVTGRGAY